MSEDEKVLAEAIEEADRRLSSIWVAMDDAVAVDSGWEGHTSVFYPEALLESLRRQGYDVVKVEVQP